MEKETQWETDQRFEDRQKADDKALKDQQFGERQKKVPTITLRVPLAQIAYRVIKKLATKRQAGGHDL